MLHNSRLLLSTSFVLSSQFLSHQEKPKDEFCKLRPIKEPHFILSTFPRYVSLISLVCKLPLPSVKALAKSDFHSFFDPFFCSLPQRTPRPPFDTILSYKTLNFHTWKRQPSVINFSIHRPVHWIDYSLCHFTQDIHTVQSTTHNRIVYKLKINPRSNMLLINTCLHNPR